MPMTDGCTPLETDMVLENVLVPTIPLKHRSDTGVVMERAGALLEREGLSLHKDHRPGQLSGGECLRAAVVRAATVSWAWGEPVRELKPACQKSHTKRV
ncbi:hypothetical protein ES705_28753 [subsurface metagenome]